MTGAHAWQLGRCEITLEGPRAHLVGILNVTPDSFSDGGLDADAEAAVRRGLDLIEQGADLLDVGGESTRPGADRVAAEEQIRRTIPVIAALRAASDVPISIDTTLSAVAEAALDAGADAINDVAAGTEDEAMPELAAARGCSVILMHRRVPPGADRYSDRYATPPAYTDVVDEVRRFLLERAAAYEAAGARREAIVIDPGLGFGKSVEQNFELIRRSRELVETGYPVLGAASRKSFLGAVTGVREPRLREAGSTAASVVQYVQGVRLFRVHDVRAHREALAVAAAAGVEPAAI